MLDVEAAVGCGAALGAGAGAAGVPVAGLGAVPVALAGAVWPVGPGVAPAGPEVLVCALVFGPPIDCPASWPFAGWLPEV